MAEEEQVAVLEQGEGDADNIVSKDVLGLGFVTDVLSVKVSVVLQVDVALNFLAGRGMHHLSVDPSPLSVSQRRRIGHNISPCWY